MQELAELPHQALNAELVELFLAPILQRAAGFLGGAVDRSELDLAHDGHVGGDLIEFDVG